MSDRRSLHAPQGANPIQTAFCAAGIPTQRMAAPFLFAGECQGEKE